MIRLENLEERALAGTVAADDADDLTLLHIEAHILERPELLDLITLNDLAPAQHVGGLASKILYAMSDDIPQCRVVVVTTLGNMADQIGLRKILDGDDGVCHCARLFR